MGGFLLRTRRCSIFPAPLRRIQMPATPVERMWICRPLTVARVLHTYMFHARHTIASASSGKGTPPHRSRCPPPGLFAEA